MCRGLHVQEKHPLPDAIMSEALTVSILVSLTGVGIQSRKARFGMGKSFLDLHRLVLSSGQDTTILCAQTP